MAAFHLAQINIARARYDLAAPEMEGFTSRLDAINALAERAPGFVWRLKDESGDALSFRIFDDPRIIVNMSMWESLSALGDFVHKTAHAKVMARRAEWFEPMGVYLALWWQPAGHPPTLAGAARRLMMLQKQGATPEAFDFKHPFEAEGAPLTPPVEPAAL
jgi:hypothetical protein